MDGEQIPVTGLRRVRDLVPLIVVGSTLNEQRVTRAAAIVQVDGREFVEVYTGSENPDDIGYTRWLYRADVTVDLG